MDYQASFQFAYRKLILLKKSKIGYLISQDKDCNTQDKDCNIQSKTLRDGYSSSILLIKPNVMYILKKDH